MLSKIQLLLESDSISLECRKVLEQAKIQANLLNALPDFRQHPNFVRFVKEHDEFWQKNIKYPLSKYDEMPVVEEILNLNDDNDDELDYEIVLSCRFTWQGCDYEEEQFNVRFLASWLNAPENQSPWKGYFVREMIQDCKIMLSYSNYLTKNKKDRNMELASLLGVSEKSLESWSNGEDSPKIIRLKNLHLFLKMVTYGDWRKGYDYKQSIPDCFVFLINARYVFDKTDEDGSCSFNGFISSQDKHLTEEEMKNAINESLKDEREQVEAEKEYKLFKQLEKKYKKDNKI